MGIKGFFTASSRNGGVDSEVEVIARAVAGAQLSRMDCRSNCGACCIAPSITSPIPGMPHGKRAGERCVQLLPDFRCALFGRPERPAFCASLRPSEEMCGANRDEALGFLGWLEVVTGASPARAVTPRLS